MRRSVVDQPFTLVLAVVVATVAAGACSKMTSSTPSAPSPVPAASAPALSGATITGQVGSGSATGVRFASSASGMTVSVVGERLSASVDASGRFRLDNVPAGEVELQFQGGAVNVRVKVGTVADHDRLEVQISLSGSVGTVEASEHVGPDDGAEVTGRILSIDASARTLTVGSATIQVSDATRIVSRGSLLTFGSLSVQERVEVKGSISGGIVSAMEIQVEDADEPGQPPEAEVEFTGTVSLLSGTCPALALTVSGTSVRTSASTDFRDSGCVAVAMGSVVEVKGTRAADGSVAATRLSVEDK